jgi:septum formation protein
VSGPQVVLASASPRRRALLGQICREFSVRPSAVEERLPPGPPADAAIALALAKARAIAAEVPDVVVLGADTIVVVDGEVLGKPESAADAVRMLRRLRNRPHEVITGVAVVSARAAREATAAVRTRVTMRDYSDAEIDAYVVTGEPLDKAGAYAVQEGGARLVARVDGCYTNVVGLPVTTTRALLAFFGVTVLSPA